MTHSINSVIIKISREAYQNILEDKELGFSVARSIIPTNNSSGKASIAEMEEANVTWRLNSDLTIRVNSNTNILVDNPENINLTDYMTTIMKSYGIESITPYGVPVPQKGKDISLMTVSLPYVFSSEKVVPQRYSSLPVEEEAYHVHNDGLVTLAEALLKNSGINVKRKYVITEHDIDYETMNVFIRGTVEDEEKLKDFILKGALHGQRFGYGLISFIEKNIRR